MEATAKIGSLRDGRFRRGCGVLRALVVSHSIQRVAVLSEAVQQQIAEALERDARGVVDDAHRLRVARGAGADGLVGRGGVRALRVAHGGLDDAGFALVR